MTLEELSSEAWCYCEEHGEELQFKYENQFEDFDTENGLRPDLNKEKFAVEFLEFLFNNR